MSSSSSWSCFTCQETGRCFKSNTAVTKSTIDLDGYEPVVCECQLREMEKAIRRLRYESIVSRTLCTVSCQLHRVDSGSTVATLEQQRSANRNGKEISDIMLVCFDYGMLPPTYHPMGLHGVALGDRTDERRRREADSDRLEEIRRQLTTVNEKPFVFIFTYGKEARSRAEEALRSRRCTFTNTPVFQTMDELYTYLTMKYKLFV